MSNTAEVAKAITFRPITATNGQTIEAGEYVTVHQYGKNRYMILAAGFRRSAYLRASQVATCAEVTL